MNRNPQTTADDADESAPKAVRVAAPVSASTPVSADNLTADQIIQNAIRRDEELRDLREGFSYQLKLVTQQLDDKDKVIPDKTKTVTAKIKPGKNITFSADFNDSGDPDSKPTQSAASRTTYAGAIPGRGLRSSGQTSDSDSGSASGNKDVDDARKVNAMLDMGKIAPRFKYEKAENQTIRNHPCYAIRFSPKKDQPYASREEKVINKVGGTLWIDQNDFSIIQTKGKLTEEVEVAWFFASMKDLDFNYETSELDEIHIPVPSNFTMNFLLNIMGYRLEQKQVSTMENYQPIPESSATPPKPASPPTSNP